MCIFTVFFCQHDSTWKITKFRIIGDFIFLWIFCLYMCLMGDQSNYFLIFVCNFSFAKKYYFSNFWNYFWLWLPAKWSLKRLHFAKIGQFRLWWDPQGKNVDDPIDWSILSFPAALPPHSTLSDLTYGHLHEANSYPCHVHIRPFEFSAVIEYM